MAFGVVAAVIRVRLVTVAYVNARGTCLCKGVVADLVRNPGIHTLRTTAETKKGWIAGQAVMTVESQHACLLIVPDMPGCHPALKALQPSADEKNRLPPTDKRLLSALNAVLALVSW